jgi:hypothetical protein
VFDTKEVLDSRFPILVTRFGKRSKNFFKKRIFGVQVDAHLIEMLIGDRV